MTTAVPERVPASRAGVRQGARISMFSMPVELERSRRMWLPLSACADEDPELFYDCESPVSRELARAVCDCCPVRAECLEAVMAEEAVLGETPLQNERYRYGVRGGLTSGERWALAYPQLARERRERESARKRKYTRKGREAAASE